MPTTEILMTVKELAATLQVSATTIYRNPRKYHMFRVGNNWRANSESLKKFAEAPGTDNNVFRLGVVGGKERKKCRSTKGVTRTGSISQRQMARELDALLAPRKKQKPNSFTIS